VRLQHAEMPVADSPSWLIELPTCVSTNTWALDHHAALAHGACIYTTAQTAGRGRMGKTWVAPPGVVTASFVIDLSHKISVTQLALAAGLALVHVVDDLGVKPPVQIKWPNDCYLNGHKLAGILCEQPAGRLDRVVIGVGLNLDPQWHQLAQDLWPVTDPVTMTASLATALGSTSQLPTPKALLSALRRYLIEATGLLAVGGWDRLLPHIRARDWLVRQSISVVDGAQTYRGVAAGIDDNGSLLLDTGAAKPQALTGGTVIITG
jgi:BirA family transcriptional regulator, biotin operon repressor / biotin---[acetyl-CoA-carboxylase] ligase